MITFKNYDTQFKDNDGKLITDLDTRLVPGAQTVMTYQRFNLKSVVWWFNGKDSDSEFPYFRMVFVFEHCFDLEPDVQTVWYSSIYTGVIT